MKRFAAITRCKQALLCSLLLLSAVAGDAPSPANTDGYLEGDIRLDGGSPALARQGKTYFVFTGGDGIAIRTSDDLVRWKKAGAVFLHLPTWAEQLFQTVNCGHQISHTLTAVGICTTASQPPAASAR